MKFFEKLKSLQKTLPVRTYLLYLLVASFLFTGVAFSKYVITGTTGDSARVLQMGTLTISETGDFVSESVTDGDIRNTLRIIPGVDLDKDIDVRFEGCEAACYVFLRVTPTGWVDIDATGHRIFGVGGTANTALQWSVDEDWTYLTNDGTDYVYYTIVEPNGALAQQNVIKDGVVTVSSSLIRSQLEALPTSLQIAVQGTAVQYDGFGDFATEAAHAAAAWNSVSAHA